MQSKYFTLEEMLRSQTASRYDIKEQFNPSKEVVDNLELLCKNILDPLREMIGAIQISSGYRSPKTNEKVGGVPNSQHVLGQAADIHPVKISHAEAFALIKKSSLPFDQLIWEYGTKQEPNWIHISYAKNPRRQVLYIPRSLGE